MIISYDNVTQDNDDNNIEQIPQKENPINQDIEVGNEENDKYCGGLLNKSDSIFLKSLKLLLVIPLLPLVLLWKFLQCTFNTTIHFCENQVFNFLVFIYGKLTLACNYVYSVLEFIWSYIYAVIKWFCTKLKNIIFALGRCSKYLIDSFAIFALNMIVRCAYIRAIIQEISSIISVPISLKIIVPTFIFIYQKIYIPLTNCFTQTLIFTFNRIIVPFYQIIILNICRFIKYFFQTIIYETIILNTFRGIKCILINFYEHIIVNFYRYIIVKLLYEYILISLYKSLKLIFYNFLYQIILINVYKGMKYFTIEILYNLIIFNIFRVLKFLAVRIIYNIIIKNIYYLFKWIFIQIKNVLICLYDSIIIRICRCMKWIMVDFLYQMILQNIFNYFIHPIYNGISKMVTTLCRFTLNYIILPFARAINYIFNLLTQCISTFIKFIFNEMLEPLWNIISTLTKSVFRLIQQMFIGLGNLSINIWHVLKRVFTGRVQ